ncbi:L-dopachrome tautomerase-related protein [uncultured Klebsiella sp.]|uniref:L-dopachrome tautomerase-related protein n=1 Tax=uncultured Klebsiella sp. TaxID=284011 RepID=UPI0028040F14|nr:L-dopachrome tautomerase-related protein [uncultured Klebsiella sp.]
MKRRDFCKATLMTTTLALLFKTKIGRAEEFHYNYQNAHTLSSKLTEVASLPWLCNAVAVTRTGRLFAGLPRWPTNEKTPSVAEILPNGSLQPFPGGKWNQGVGDSNGEDVFVCVNTIHIFDDDTLWVVDQGNKNLSRDAQKLLQFDIKTRKLLRRFTFDETILPEGGNINDLRLDKENIYLTDSGLGAIIVINQKTGTMLRRLAGHYSTQATSTRPPIGEKGQLLQKSDGSMVMVNADPIEISPDGKWLYYQPLTGPLYKVPTNALRDEKLPEHALGERVQFVYDTPTLVGTAIDSKGNIYLAEFDRPRITVLAPDGTLQVVVEDERLWGPDAMFISNKHELYIPCPQSGRLAANRGPEGKDAVIRPYHIYKLALPASAGMAEKVPPVSM